METLRPWLLPVIRRSGQARSPEQPLVVWLSKLGAIALAYLIAARFGFSHAFTPQGVPVVWPASGVALVAMLVAGHRAWPGVWLGAFLAHATMAEPLLTAASVAAGNTLASVIAAALLQRFAGFDRALVRVRDVLALVLLGAAAACTVSATFGATSLALGGIIEWAAWNSLWRTWWIVDAMGIVLVAPLLLTWLESPRPGWSRRRWAELAALFVTVTCVSSLVFHDLHATARGLLGLEYAVFPCIMWSALRFTQRETASAVVLVGGFAVWATLHDRGPFAIGAAESRLVLLQLFLAVTAVTAFVVGAATSQRRSAEIELRQRHERLAAAEKLRTQQARLLAAERIAQLGTWELDLVTGAVSWSDELYKIYGLDPESHVASLAKYFEQIHPDDRQRVSSVLEDARRTCQPFGFTERIVRADGAVRILHSKGDVVCDAAGRPLRIIGTSQDVTEQELAEERLARQTRLYETLLLAQSQIGDGVALTEGQKIRYANDALAKIYGSTIEELYALPSFLDLIAPEQRGLALERLRLRTEGRGVDHSELIAMRRDGSRFHIEYASTSIVLNGRLHMFSIVRDVTEVRRSEEARRQLAAIVESAEVAIVGETLDGTVRSWNAGAERLYGYTAAEMVGRSIELLLPPGREQEESELIGRVRRGETVDSYETVRRHKHGRELQVSLTMSPIRDSTGALAGVSKITRDVTAVKEAQRAVESSLREKEVLLKEIHHRVKNNLQIISSLLNLQSRHLDAPAAKAVLVESDMRVRAIALVHEKLYQAQSLASIALEPYLRSLTTGLIHSFGDRRKVDVCAQDIVLGVDGAIPCGLIVNELVSNALKHAFPDDRPGCITVSLREIEGSRLHLEVVDDGVGMPPGFDFRRATSMGLQLVCGLTQQLKGEIELLPGPGTRFSIRFPKAR